MKSSFKFFFLAVIMGFGCKPGVTPPSPPPPVSPPPPPAPVAVVGGPYTSTTGVVTFDGSGSSDPGGSALTYNWNFGDNTTGTGQKPSHTYQTDGTFNVSLTVTNAASVSSAPSTTTANVARAQAGEVLVGAGNIATCGSNNDQKTALLIDAIPGTVFTLGDNVFEGGTADEYANCYAPTWGRFLTRTRPVLGNHDYANGSSNAEGSFSYFGDRFPGPPGLGYYSYDLGSWHVIVLNDKGDAKIDAAQMQWLNDDLNAHTNQCTIAMWHVPAFLSSNLAGWTVNPSYRPLWNVLYAKGVDVAVNGQQHNYERMAPMTPAGDVDQANGIRQFNVGTGGESVDVFSVIHPNSQTRAAVYGVLKLTLKPGSYDWQFVPVAGESYTDSGSGSCH